MTRTFLVIGIAYRGLCYLRRNGWRFNIFGRFSTNVQNKLVAIHHPLIPSKRPGHASAIWTMELDNFPMHTAQTKHQLQEEVERLEQELSGEIEVKRVLQCAVKGPIGCCDSCSTLSPLLPFKVQMLLAEIALVEEEIEWLERKIYETKLDLYKQKQENREGQVMQLKGLQQQREEGQLRKLPSRSPNQIQNKDFEILSTSQNWKNNRCKTPRARRASLGSFMEFQLATSNGKYDGETEDNSRNLRCSTSPSLKYLQADGESESLSANELSVELIKCLIGIFLNINQDTYKSKGPTSQAKHTLTCMNSKGLLAPRAAFSCRKPLALAFTYNACDLDPYEILPEQDTAFRDVGPYKNFIQITLSTMDRSRLSDCFPLMRRLRLLLQKLSKISINCLTHKQKLAFWINVYNASIMHAFLQYGVSQAQERLLALVNEAKIDVAGFVLKASTIEHVILCHPSDNKHELTDEKEIFLRHACGLSYPEPNVAFALCRGNWSSPALRFYKSDDVMNELERGKAEYLEASVGVTSRKKILLPKLLDWHMKEFADDMESLLEWIYSQLPQTSSLKGLMMECLNGEIKSQPQKLIEIQPYATEFRYLVPI